MSRRLAGALATAAALLAVAAPPASAATSLALPWSASAFIDHQPPYGGSAPRAHGQTMAAVSCPSASLCVAGDTEGGIVTSTDPAAGPASWRIARLRTRTRPGFNQGIDGVSCPSTSLCVAVDSADDVLTSTDPAGGPSKWSIAMLPPGGRSPSPVQSGLSAVSCPSVTLCVATDVEGDVLVSTDPVGGASKWRRVRIDPQTSFGITGISCPTVRMCVAVDSNGGVLTSTDPTGLASAWRRFNVDASTGLFGVSCPTVSLCVAVGLGRLLTSSDPTGGSSKWQQATIGDASTRLNAVSCLSAQSCVAVDQAGDVISSSDPAGSSPAWSETPVDLQQFEAEFVPDLIGLTSVSCPSASFCLAVDSVGNAVRSNQPTGGSGAWTVEQIDGANSGAALTCGASWCVGVDQAGNILSSTQPNDASAWTITPVERGASPLGSYGAVSCPSTQLCAAVDGNGDALTSETPLSGAGWNASTIDRGNTLTSVSCPSISLCVAVDGAGNVVTSTAPASGAAAWTLSHVDTNVDSSGNQPSLNDVSCPSTSLCAAVDSAGNVFVSTDPTGGPSAWTPADINGSAGLTSIACPSASLCVAGGDRKLLVSTAPAGGAQTWVASDVPYSPRRLSCTTISLCTAMDNGGGVLASTDPAGGGSAWILTHPFSGYSWASACSASGWCVALDGTGAASFARPTTLRRLLSAPLASAASPPARARHAKRLLARGGYRFTFVAPLPGQMVLTWRAGSALIGAARASFAEAGSKLVKLTLTRAGRKLVRKAGRVRLLATATFAATGYSPRVRPTISRRISLVRP